VPRFSRDPEFALAHASLGVCYSGTGQRQLSIQSATRAYELRQRTTDRERFFIEYAYDRDVTGDLEKAFQGVTVPTMAIELLQANVPYERAVPATAFNFFFGSPYPVYVRGQAYAASELLQQAVAEFQKILDHPGLMMGDPAGARARLEKRRSLARAGNWAADRTAYQDFLALWQIS
jgi:hypothetical protein